MKPTTNQLDHINRTLAYGLACHLVTAIDDHLARRTCHYRNSAGELLTTLDEVVRAILDDDLEVSDGKPTG